MATRTAPRKTAAERGPLGAWAYSTRTLLDVSSLDAAAAAGVTEPTLRKIEGGSNRNPSRRVVWDLWQFLASRGAAQGIPVEDPPSQWRSPIGHLGVEPETRAADMATVLAQLTAAISAQTAEIAALRLEREAWERGVLQALAATEGRARSALLDALAPRPLEAAPR